VSLQDYLEDPWKKSHPSYGESAFGIKPAPEFSTAEVVVASLYRAVGFDAYSENMVPSAGKELDRRSASSSNSKPTANTIAADTWQTILRDVLASPKQPNQSSKRFLQLCPLVPEISLYSGSARLAGNSWNPGTLIQRMIQMGCETKEEAQTLWGSLFDALSVNSDDDAWARWLQSEFERRKSLKTSWKRCDLIFESDMPTSDKSALRYPAKQFVVDLSSVIEAKDAMTRRQWVSLLEAIVRIGAVAHVLWLCALNGRLWGAVLSVLNGEEKRFSSCDAIRESIFQADKHYLSYGNLAMPPVRDLASEYLASRLGLNLVLWEMESLGIEIKKLDSADDIFTFLTLVGEQANRLKTLGTLERFHELSDTHARTLACKKGIGSNLLEFSRYTLGKRQTADQKLRSYDQSYVLNKRGTAKSAPWVLSLGPVALLAIVHCCLREFSGPRSVKHLSKHLELYGINVSVNDIGTSDLGRELRMLGLILDSPDAESGILLVPPFNVPRQKGVK
jgi:hypothetical protein